MDLLCSNTRILKMIKNYLFLESEFLIKEYWTIHHSSMLMKLDLDNYISKWKTGGLQVIAFKHYFSPKVLKYMWTHYKIRVMSLDRLVLLVILTKRTEIMERGNIGMIMETFSSESGLTIKKLKETCISCNQMAFAPNLK